MSNAPQSQSAVTIILPVFNGAAHLPKQLESIAAQTHENWRLVISDDGSDDDSARIIRVFAKKYMTKVQVRSGLRAGLTRHVNEILKQLPSNTQLIALCDQDDIWFPDKLADDCSEMARLTDANAENAPILLCRRTMLCDAIGTPMGLSPLRKRKPSFGNALVQNIASGNTMVFNSPLLKVLQDTIEFSNECPFHDWWIYQLATGVDGAVYLSKEPKILYRQHSKNLVGNPRGLAGFTHQMLRFLGPAWKSDVDAQLRVLESANGYLTASAKQQVQSYITAQSGPVFRRLKSFYSSGAHRQSLVESWLLWVAVFAGKL